MADRKKERELYIDIVKILSSYGIVILHLNSNLFRAGGAGASGELALHALHQLLYAFVPVFMLATGAVFLARPTVVTYRKIGANAMKILGCIVIFGSLFWLMERVFLHLPPWDIREMLLAILTDKTWSHMWYLYVLLGIYLILPVLSVFVRHTKPGEQFVFCGILFFFGCLYNYVAGRIGYIPVQLLPIRGIWVFYVMMGGLIGQLDVEKLKKYLVPAVAATAVSAGLILYRGFQGPENILLEDHVYTVFFAVCFFLAVRILCAERKSPSWSRVPAECALGIYLIHPVFIHVMIRLLHWEPQAFLPVLTIPATAVCIWLLAFGCVFAYFKIFGYFFKKSA